MSNQSSCNMGCCTMWPMVVAAVGAQPCVNPRGFPVWGAGAGVGRGTRGGRRSGAGVGAMSGCPGVRRSDKKMSYLK
jgi:hypothetical protein